MTRYGADANDRFARLTRLWRVRVDRTVQTASSIIGFGARAGDRVVLKVAARNHDEWNAGAVAAAFAGAGMVRVIEHRPGAALLEELRPATPLTDLVRGANDHAANDVIIDVARALFAAAPTSIACPTAADFAGAFDAYIAGADTSVPKDLVEEAHAQWRELCRTQRTVRLLHGDLQHTNILFDDDRGWLAIDPKGVIAEPAFELGAALRNPPGFANLWSAPAALERRARQLAAALDLDGDRVVRWTFAQAVLSAMWMVEDGETVAPDAAPLQVARAARALLGATSPAAGTPDPERD